MHKRLRSSDLTHYQDYLSFMDEVVEAYENFHLDAYHFTLDSIGGFGGPLIARVVWRSPLVKVGKRKTIDGLHLTLMDANSVEITGSAWGAAAVLFSRILHTGNIYKFSLVVLHVRQTGALATRLIDQPIELRFSGLAPPEEVHQSPYPDIDHKLFTADYDNLAKGEVCSIVGLVVAFPASETGNHVILSNGYGECVQVKLRQEKMEEVGALNIIPFYTVLGLHGVVRVEEVGNNSFARTKLPNMFFESFPDTLLIAEPSCEDSKCLVVWRNIWSVLIYLHLSLPHQVKDDLGVD